MWGVRLFKEASTASERRIHRTTRRAINRSTMRIAYLKEVFSDEINKVDPGFLNRLELGFLHPEDKKERYTLFCDVNFTDTDYYKKYPTIFHLRKDLIYSTEEHDVRLVYLALLNMYKHRGHFINDGLDAEHISGNINDLFADFDSCLVELFGREHIKFVGVELERIMYNKELSKG